MTEDSVSKFNRLTQEQAVADAERRRKRNRKRMPKRQNYYLARWRRDQRRSGADAVDYWVPDVPDIDGKWSCLDLRPDISVADGWCIINHMSDVSWADTPGLIKLANNPRDRGNAPRVVFNNRLGIETGANQTLGQRVMTIMLSGDDNNPNMWNRLRATSGNYEVHCGVLLHEMPRISGGAVIDNFNRTNEGPPPSSSWSAVTPTNYGGYGTNWAVNASTIARSAGDDWSVRWDTDVGGGEHWFSVDLVTMDVGGSADFGIWGRANSTTNDASGYFYVCDIDNSHRLWKSTSAGLGNGGGTALGSDDTTGETVVGSTVKITCDGSTISGDLDATEYHSETDTTYPVTSRARGGLTGFTGSGGWWNEVDNFSGAGLIVDATPTPLYDTNSDLIIVGEKINIVAPTALYDSTADWVGTTFLPLAFDSDDSDVTMTGQKVATTSMSYFTNTNWLGELEAPTLIARPVIETVKMFAPSAAFIEEMR